MAITVKHSKTSTIPDGADTDLIRPSDWNADHTLTGLGTMAEQNASSVAITGGSVNGTSLGATTAASAKVTTLDIGSGLTLATDAGTAGQVLTSAGAGSVPVWSTNGAGDVVGPASSTDNAIARFDSTTGKLLQNSVVTVGDTGAIAGATSITNINYVDFDTAYATTLTEGQLGWDGNNTLGLGMAGGNVVQRIGEDAYVYVKASATITKGQLCMFTGAVGASGVITAAPSTGVTVGQYIIGLAAENIANNGFGLIQVMGSLRGFDTSAFVDGDVLYYDSAVTGGMTNVYPTSGPIITVAAVTNAANAGSGSVQVRVSVTQRLTSGTGISVAQNGTGTVITNSAPDQTVVLTAGTGISTSGTYPNFTVTNTAPDQTVVFTNGTGISVTGTYPNFTVAVVDGVYTTGSYADPTWITSLAGSKISGTLDGGTF